MLDPNIKDALQITLNDHRMSRGEKRAMAKVIEQHVKTDHELSHARSVLFELARQELTDPQALKIMDWVEEASKVLAERPDPSKSLKSEAYFSPSDNCTSKIIRLFQEARVRKCADPFALLMHAIHPYGQKQPPQHKGHAHQMAGSNDHQESATAPSILAD